VPDLPSTIAQNRRHQSLNVTLNGLLPTGQVRGVRRGTPPIQVDALLRARLGQQLRVNVLRLEAETGHIFVSERVPSGQQLSLL
jgi:hypothetical protein